MLGAGVGWLELRAAVVGYFRGYFMVFFRDSKQNTEQKGEAEMNTQKSKEGTFSPLEIETKMNRWTHTIAYVFMPSVFLRQGTR